MKKVSFLGIIILLVGLLAACGASDSGTSSDQPAEENSTEQSSGEEKEEAANEEASNEELYEFNQEMADNENFKATLINIERIYDEAWDEEKIEVTFEVENKRDDSVEFQARQVSINGKMVDEALLSMSTEVAGGKMADAVLTIQDYEGGDLPSLDEDFEMLLHVFSWDNMDYEEDAEVSVTFK
ncbi:hypothetical protein CWR48_13305 [Oceanobacillus arenosus]|uniref:DUF5067 domain-containing protein n=1 Tax=Oceanobacillus arenosus TaxID=1229153 RepID=A0A3D8PPP1_9BACI|nr:hypothetical protein [Oceanobacillus arenosus]RDW17497.1 hypothetical protein CWR48_13305 [Oceanobacillus arenosus]